LSGLPLAGIGVHRCTAEAALTEQESECFLALPDKKKAERRRLRPADSKLIDEQSGSAQGLCGKSLSSSPPH
jgi:hypothetical protein